MLSNWNKAVSAGDWTLCMNGMRVPNGLEPQSKTMRGWWRWRRMRMYQALTRELALNSGRPTPAIINLMSQIELSYFYRWDIAETMQVDLISRWCEIPETEADVELHVLGSLCSSSWVVNFLIACWLQTSQRISLMAEDTAPEHGDTRSMPSFQPISPS